MLSTCLPPYSEGTTGGRNSLRGNSLLPSCNCSGMNEWSRASVIQGQIPGWQEGPQEHGGGDSLVKRGGGETSCPLCPPCEPQRGFGSERAQGADAETEGQGGRPPGCPRERGEGVTWRRGTACGVLGMLAGTQRVSGWLRSSWCTLGSQTPALAGAPGDPVAWDSELLGTDHQPWLESDHPRGSPPGNPQPQGDPISVQRGCSIRLLGPPAEGSRVVAVTWE